ncbi:MAG: hypothetical protein WBG73_13245 [Coleofasciculaceae cyanobacterium]
MFNFNSLKSGTAALLALGITSAAVAPLMTITPASAQVQNRFPQREQQNLIVSSGTSIPVRYDKDKIVVMPDEKMSITLTVASDITNNEGRVVIPQGSKITGDIEPVSRGSRFVAREVTIYRRLADKQSMPFSISGTSNVVTRMEEVKKGASTGSILTGAAVGAGAAAAIAAITGDRAIATEELLGGAGLGAVGGLFLNRKKVEAVVIYPDQDLTVTLTSQFARRF